VFAVIMGGMASPILTVVVLGALVAAAGCQTASQRKAAEDAALRKHAVDEIDRICALHGAERQAALEKMKRESGMELFCSD
jgi:hypothetical protein